MPHKQGVRRPPLPDRLPIKRVFAVHEVGKGLVATVLRQRTGRLEKVERVSIVPRGRWVPKIFASCDLFAGLPRGAWFSPLNIHTMRCTACALIWVIAPMASIVY